MLDITLFQDCEGIKRPISQDTLHVTLTKAIPRSQAEIFTSAFNMAFAKFNSNLTVSCDLFEKYITTLTHWRVMAVNHKKIPLESKQILIPSVFAVAILQVGKVYDAEQGLTLIPSFEPSPDMLLTPAEMLNFSDSLLRLLRDMGCSFEYGLPRDLDGSLEVMYFHFAESQVLRHDNRTHPGMAALASFFEFQQTQSLLHHRVSYGFISEQELVLRQIILKSVS